MADNSFISKLSKFFYRKETLLWTPLLMDVTLAAMTYPMFYNGGLKGYLNALKVNNDEIDKLEKDKNVSSVWELSMIAYSGYCVLLASSTYCCYYYPQCRKPTGFAMLALMIAKKLGVGKMDTNNEELMSSKDNGLLYFYFPFYGGYCLINLYQWYQSK